MNEATHNKGHTVVISRPFDYLVDNVQVHDTGGSDHFWVDCSILGPKAKTAQKSVMFHKIKSINVHQFKSDISSFRLGNLKSFKHLDDIVSLHDTELRNLMDKHAPVTTKLVTLHTEAP